MARATVLWRVQVACLDCDHRETLDVAATANRLARNAAVGKASLTHVKGEKYGHRLIPTVLGQTRALADMKAQATIDAAGPAPF